MGMFATREPRKYRKVRIYTDERKEKLDKLVTNVRREMGEIPASDIDPDRFKGAFGKFTPHVQRQKESGMRKLSWPIILFAIIVLIFVWHYLLTGNVHF